MIFYEILTGKVPFEGEEEECNRSMLGFILAVHCKNKRPDMETDVYNSKLGEARGLYAKTTLAPALPVLSKLIQDMWVADPTKRPTMDTVCQVLNEIQIT